MLINRSGVTFLICTSTMLICHCWPGFQVLTERTEVTYNDNKTVHVWLKTGRSNRTTITTNASIHVYETIPANAVVTIVGYEFKSNEYRRSAIDISKYTCDFFNGEYKLLFKKTLEQKGENNLPTSCPIKKGHYYYKNFVMESVYIPFKPVGERWMFEGNLTANDNLLTRILWYIKIERNAEFWSH